MDRDDVIEFFDPEQVGTSQLESEHWVRKLFFDHPNDPPTSIRLVGWLYELNRETPRTLVAGVDLSKEPDLPEDTDGP